MLELRFKSYAQTQTSALNEKVLALMQSVSSCTAYFHTWTIKFTEFANASLLDCKYSRKQALYQLFVWRYFHDIMLHSLAKAHSQSLQNLMIYVEKYALQDGVHRIRIQHILLSRPTRGSCEGTRIGLNICPLLCK